ncbi:MAG: hypothetical protein H8D23_05045 [Candidatus Brocadiales bacterium]|nr:hypothetical protein [Candidatus Brocadiales bacterium]
MKGKYMDLLSTINNLIADKKVDELKKVMRENNLIVRNGKIENNDKNAVAFWDKRQLVKKINLNS